MIGQTVSHYRVMEKVGGGGMGVLYDDGDAIPPSFSPNGKRIVFWSIRREGVPDGQRDIWMINLK
jgi:hypothetical protein